MASAGGCPLVLQLPDQFDEDGYLYFLDRKHDYLRRSGENISSMEFEAALYEHPDISVVAAHAVPSELGEDEVKITAVLRDGSMLRESDLFAWAQGRIPALALPRHIEFRHALPTSPLGKPLKYELKHGERPDSRRYVGWWSSQWPNRLSVPLLVGVVSRPRQGPALRSSGGSRI